MKTLLFIINLLAFLLTIGCHIYSSFYNTYGFYLGGLIAQFFLGVLQFLIAFGLSIRWKSLSTLLQKHIRRYWIIVGLYGIGSLLYFASYQINNFIGTYSIDFFESNETLFVLIVPMSIACYLMCITYLNIKEK